MSGQPGIDWVYLRSMQAQVQEFHARVLPPGVTPQVQFLKLVEEVGELARALHKGDRVLTVDGLADCLYVLLGISNLCNVDLTTAFLAVHASNMTKMGDGTLSPRGARYIAPVLGGLAGTILCNACSAPATFHRTVIDPQGKASHHWCEPCAHALEKDGLL